MPKKRTSAAIGTLIAAGIGYTIGVLTAPKSGKETRKDVRNAASRAISEAEKNLKKLHSELSTLITQSKRKAKSTKNKAGAGLNEAIAKAQVAKDKVRDILSALHEGESDDKDLQKAITEVNKAIANLKKFVTKNEVKKAKN